MSGVRAARRCRSALCRCRRLGSLVCSPRSRLARARQLVEDRCGLSEDHRAGDAKLVLMYVAIVAGCVAQFWPTPFPANRPLLAVCVAAFAPAAATPLRAALSTFSAAPPLRAPSAPAQLRDHLFCAVCLVPVLRLVRRKRHDLHVAAGGRRRAHADAAHALAQV